MSCDWYHVYGGTWSASCHVTGTMVECIMGVMSCDWYHGGWESCHVWECLIVDYIIKKQYVTKMISGAFGRSSFSKWASWWPYPVIS